MSGIEFFDDSFSDSTKEKSKFHHQIVHINRDTVPVLANFFMNNKNDKVFGDSNVSIYMVVQYGPSLGKPADYIEKTRGTRNHSNVLESIHLNFSSMTKATSEGLVTSLEVVEAKQTQQPQVINVGIGGCGPCEHSSSVKAVLDEKDAIIKTQQDTIKSLVESLKKDVGAMASELGVKESPAIHIEELPNQLQRRFIASCLMEAETIDELNFAIEQAKLLAIDPELSKDAHIMDLISEHHATVSYFAEFLSIALHKDSDGGEYISQAEYIILNKQLQKLRKITAELSAIVAKNRA